MYIHLGAETVVRSRHVIGIFDTDNTTLSKITRDYLSRAEKEGRVVTITYDLPKSFVICQNENGEETVYAKSQKGSHEPEPDTVAFLSETQVLNNVTSGFQPGDVDKYTVVIWLEGAGSSASCPSSWFWGPSSPGR